MSTRRQSGDPPMTLSPARRVAFETVLRVFEDDAYADRAFRAAAVGLDPRDRALAQRPRLRDRPARPHARPRDRNARQAAGGEARPARAGGAAARRLPARVL